MKGLALVLFILFCLVYFSGCKKDNSSSKSAPQSTWTFKGMVDTGMAMSVSNNMQFIYAINGQAKSITVDFYSAVRQNYIYSVADTLTDSTGCTVIVNDGNGQYFYSSGRLKDKVTETIANRLITIDFTNVEVISAADTQLVSASLRFPSVY
jgi:hypothetical protein